jgi:hypothetical protein
MTTGSFDHVDMAWEDPGDRLLVMRTPASFARLIRFDRPGTGASDRLSLGSLPPATAGVRRAHQQGRPVLDRFNGVPVSPNRSHRITVNSFLADGGDNFTVLTQGTNRLGGAVDLDVLGDCFPPTDLSPGPEPRRTCGLVSRSIRPSLCS